MEQKKTFIVNTIYYSLIVILVFVFVKYVYPIVSPFIFGFILAMFAILMARKVFKKDEKYIRILSLFLIYFIILALIVLLIALGINELGDFFSTIPNLYKTYIEPSINMVEKNLTFFDNLSPELAAVFDEAVIGLFDAIKAMVISVSQFLVSKTTNIISSAPSALVGTIIVIVSSFFIAIDYEKMLDYFDLKVSSKIVSIFNEVKYFVYHNVFLIGKSYFLIMMITFIELLIGFFVLKIKNFALLALIIAVLDILPVLGVGTVLIPWFIVEFILGDYYLGIGLGILYLVITIIRNIIEPKIVGGNLGLHPLATLFSMIIGMNLFGFLGLFGLPLTFSFFVNRKKQISNSV